MSTLKEKKDKALAIFRRGGSVDEVVTMLEVHPEIAKEWYASMPDTDKQAIQMSTYQVSQVLASVDSVPVEEVELLLRCKSVDLINMIPTALSSPNIEDVTKLKMCAEIINKIAVAIAPKVVNNNTLIQNQLREASDTEISKFRLTKRD